MSLFGSLVFDTQLSVDITSVYIISRLRFAMYDMQGNALISFESTCKGVDVHTGQTGRICDTNSDIGGNKIISRWCKT